MPHFYKGEVVGEHRRYDERLTQFLLRYRAPLTYARHWDRAPVEGGHAEKSAETLAGALNTLAVDRTRGELEAHATALRDRVVEDRRIAAGLADDSDAAAVARAAGDLAVAVTERDRYAAEVARAAALRDADDMREWHELQVARLAAARDGEAQLAVARTAVRAAEAAAAAAGVAGLDGDLADGDGTGAVTPDVARPSRTSGAAATRGPGGQGGALNRLGRRAARRRTARAARRRRRAAGRP